MKNNLDTILKEYRSADFNRRIHMYLQFPPLRPKFMTIDQCELNDKMSSSNAGQRGSRIALRAMLISFPVGCLRRLFGMVQAS